MFYEPDKANHGLRYSPLKACVVPRPIAWISTQSENGSLNLAPFSFFNLVSEDPAILMISISQKANHNPKDTLKNILLNKEFTVNLVPNILQNQMIKTSEELEYGYSEIDYTKLETEKSITISPPRIKGTPIALECILFDTQELPKNAHGGFCTMVLGKITGVFIDDRYIKDGRVKVKDMNLVARLGYNEYTTIDDIYCINRK